MNNKLGKELRRIFKNLRDTFNTYRKSLKKVSGSAAKPKKPWVYMAHMEFLSDHMLTRTSSSNVVPETQDSQDFGEVQDYEQENLMQNDDEFEDDLVTPQKPTSRPLDSSQRTPFRTLKRSRSDSLESTLASTLESISKSLTQPSEEDDEESCFGRTIKF